MRKLARCTPVVSILSILAVGAPRLATAWQAGTTATPQTSTPQTSTPPLVLPPLLQAPTPPVLQAPKTAVGRPPTSLRTPAPPKVSKELRDYLAGEARALRAGLPKTLAQSVEGFAVATRCATGCDQIGGQGIVLSARITDFDVNTMPDGRYKGRLPGLVKQICDDAEMQTRLFSWGTDLVVDLVDRRSRKVEQVAITAERCGLPPPSRPARDQTFSLRGKRGCLDIERKSRTDGAILVSATCDDTASQSFQFRFVAKTRSGQEIWQLVNANSRLCLEVDGSALDTGMTIKQTACDDKKESQWFRWLTDAEPFNQISTSGSLNLDVTFGQSHRFAVTQQASKPKFEQYFQAFPAKTLVVSGWPAVVPPVPPIGQPPAPQPPTPVTPPKLAPPIDEVLAEAERKKKAEEERKAREEAARQARVDRARAAADLTSTERAASVSEAIGDIRKELPSAKLTFVGQQFGSLEDGGEHETRLGNFWAGHGYEVTARCDQGCLDLDLTVLDPRGEEVDSHTESDREPVVFVKPPTNQVYTLVVGMANCWADPCRWGLIGARRPLLEEKMSEVETEIRRRNLSVVARRKGSLEDGEETKVSLPVLRTGSVYAITARCDDDCDDLDLILLDRSGQEVEEDTASDDEPVVEVEPPATQAYSAIVEMKSCDREPCFWELVVVRGSK